MLRTNVAATVALAVVLSLAASPARAVTVSEPYLVMDFNPEVTGPTHMTGGGDTLFFTVAYYRPYRLVLWKSDGTPAGTVPVADIGWFEDPASFGDLLVFQGPGGLWRSDGTGIGTHLIAPVYPFGEDRLESPPMIVRDGTLFVAGCGPNRTACGLWRSDGTPERTILVKEGFGSEIAPFRGGLIGSHGWTSDGTAEGTQRFSLKALGEVRVVGDDLVVFTDCGSHGEPCQLWRTDLTDEGRFPIATVIERYDDENYYDDNLYPTVLPSAAGDGRFVVCAEGDDGGVWSSDGTAEGTRLLARDGCGPHTIKQKVGGVWLFNTGVSLWRSDGTADGTYPLASFRSVQMLGGTKGIVLFAVRADDGGTELWQSDGTEAGTFAVSPMPTLGWTENSDDGKRPVRATAGDTVFFCGCMAPYSSFVTCEADNGCGVWAITISGPSTTTTTTSTTTSTTSTTLLPDPVGVILADVSVVKKDPSLNLGGFTHLLVDGNPPTQTFIRARVTGLGTQPPLAATLRLQVARERGPIFKSKTRGIRLVKRAASRSAGRIHLVKDCHWNELRMTWEDRPVIDTDPLDTKGAVVRGQFVEFDITSAITGDGTYCFGLDSLSRDGVAYYSREQGRSSPRAPQLLLVPADPSARVGVVVADASVRETQPDRNLGRSAILRVDGKSVKRTFLRVRVRGFDAELVRVVRLRLQVDDGKSARGPAGRLYEVSDCTWDELTVTYDMQPDIDGPLLDELDEIVRSGDVVDFDITPAITGDGDYCFALESSSRDGVTYRSREAAVGGPVIVTTNIPTTP